jgi:predicted lipid carrier protein YhbT
MNAAQPAPLLPARIAGLVSRLPQWPPSAVLCAGLNLLFLPTLDAQTKQHLLRRIVAIQVSDAGLECRVSLTLLGFIPALRGAPEVTIRACAWDYYRLARRIEDPDTLFFSRRLAIEGDTELGLLLKNALDAIDWARLPGSLGPVVERLCRLVESRVREDRPATTANNQGIG